MFPINKADNLEQDLKNLEIGDLIVLADGHSLTVVRKVEKRGDGTYPIRINGDSYTKEGFCYAYKNPTLADIHAVIKKEKYMLYYWD